MRARLRRLLLTNDGAATPLCSTLLAAVFLIGMGLLGGALATIKAGAA